MPRCLDESKCELTIEAFVGTNALKEESMAHKLTDARRSLIRTKESAKKRLEELDEERRELRATLKSLDAALRALGQTNRPRPIPLG